MFRRPRVLTTGTFALPHPGHFALFAEIRKRWPDCYLIVGVNGDRRTQELKWYAVLPARLRAYMIGACRWVDSVFIFEEDTPAQLIEELKPDIYVKGPDWRGREDEMPEIDVCRRLGTQVEFIAAPVRLSGSEIAEQIARRYHQ